MPILRFSVEIELTRGTRVFLNLEGGVMREAARKVERTALFETGTLPDFMVIGAQKCGTGFFYRLLGQHPNVELAVRKEVHYFDDNFDKGTDWYRSHFPPPVWKEGRWSITGEASPYYMLHPRAARRMAELVPKARLIALLRDPVDRAYSHYQHQVRAGHENLGFEEAIEAEPARLRGERERLLEDEHYTSYNHRHFSYLSRGIYADQLMEWSKFFRDDQMLALKSEDFFHGLSTDVLGPVLSFLGLPDWKPQAQKPRSREKARYPPMDPAIRRQLRSYFEPHNQRLYEYLGVDLGW